MENQGEPQSAGTAKIVIIVYQPDGTSFINQIQSATTVAEDIGSKAGTVVSRVKFNDVPKRIRFFLEKWGVPEKSIDVKKVKSAKQEN